MGYQALLFCPDEKAARGVTQVLSELDFTVEPCTEPFAAVKKLMAQHFDAIVVDCDNEQNATLLFKSARNSASNQSSLAVAVVEGQAGVAKAFRIGANLVLTKPINVEQAKGTLRVARGLLRKGGDLPKTGDASSAPANVPSTATPATPKPAAKPTMPASPAAPAATTKAWPDASKPAAPARPTHGTEKRPTQSASASTETAPKVSAPKPETTFKPAKPSPANAQPVAGKNQYPWQAVKPGAEPMASALKKAAEAAGIAPPEPEISAEKKAEVPPVSPLMSAGAAAAPAPAKEKPVESTKAAPPTPTVSNVPKVPAASPKTVEPEQVSAPLHATAETSTADELHTPSFSMGAPAVDEEEPPSSKKAIIILAIVAVLASMAGYLGWKNMSDKSPAKAPASQTQAPATTSVQTPSPAASTTSEPVTASAPTSLSAPAPAEPATSTQPAKPSPKMIAKDSTKSIAAATAPSAEPTSENPPTALVVHNETSRAAAKSAPAENESAPAPNALGLMDAADPKALSAIGNAPVAVPKASNQVVRVSQGVSEGLILKKVQPRYPSQALQMRTEGSVQMQATISKTGSISNVKILSGDPMLSRAAVEAVQQWKYKPYYLDGEPVDIQTQITINFRLPK